ncbi:hypothetical protein COLO4_16302 [Corchorus olitorius]|uniref:Uncharacterized protein n=1 Tax=Corchorus olitorius TaxID=93759 RepID=A0A1R3JIC8_9ROSI|nr:hypothetical protein COLO4_16302 [Corchorus olitorius]
MATGSPKSDPGQKGLRKMQLDSSHISNNQIKFKKL